MKLNAIVIADDVAENIGELCVMLKYHTKQLLEQFGQANVDIQIDMVDYCHDVINKDSLSEKVSHVNSNNFLCCWYGHGNDVSFSINGESIVTTTENHYIFSNALIYTFSCMNGGTLADVLIENNTKVFVGYNSNANCPYGLDDITCDIAMSFVSSFLSGKTIKDAVDDLKMSYEEAIFNEDLEPFQRFRFQENRDGITIKGDGTLTIEDILVA
jgi:hypothetical protein